LRTVRGPIKINSAVFEYGQPLRLEPACVCCAGGPMWSLLVGGTPNLTGFVHVAQVKEIDDLAAASLFSRHRPERLDQSAGRRVGEQDVRAERVDSRSTGLVGELAQEGLGYAAPL
jgi:hypothetical protein